MMLGSPLGLGGGGTRTLARWRDPRAHSYELHYSFSLCLLMHMLVTESPLLHTAQAGLTICSYAINSARASVVWSTPLFRSGFLLLVLVAKASLFHTPSTGLTIKVFAKHFVAGKLGLRSLAMTALGALVGLILLLVLKTVASLFHATLARLSSSFASPKDGLVSMRAAMVMRR